MGERQSDTTARRGDSKPAVRIGLSAMRVCENILLLAPWAPSGDNTRPWRFEVKGELEVAVHGSDTRDHCVYDLDGNPSQMAWGALLKIIGIAATRHGLFTDVTRRMALPERKPTFDVRFTRPALRPSPLIPFITFRAVRRWPLSTRALTVEKKLALEASVAHDHQIMWFETPRQRWRVPKLLFHNAKLRLTMREAFEVDRSVSEWNAQFSEGKIPDQAAKARDDPGDFWPVSPRTHRLLLPSRRREIWCQGRVRIRSAGARGVRDSTGILRPRLGRCGAARALPAAHSALTASVGARQITILISH